MTEFDIEYWLADVESAIKPTKVCLETTSELKDASHKVIHDQPELPVVDDSVCESAIGSRGKDVTDSGRVEEEEVAEASYAGEYGKRMPTLPTLLDMVCWKALLMDSLVSTR